MEVRERHARDIWVCFGSAEQGLASSVPFMPKSLVGRVGRRYAAGEEGEDALRVVGSLAREGCLATVGMLGEFATDERHTPTKG